MTTNLITENSEEISHNKSSNTFKKFYFKGGNGILDDRKYGSRECFSLVFCFSQVGRSNICVYVVVMGTIAVAGGRR